MRRAASVGSMRSYALMHATVETMCSITSVGDTTIECRGSFRQCAIVGRSNMLPLRGLCGLN